MFSSLSRSSLLSSSSSIHRSLHKLFPISSFFSSSPSPFSPSCFFSSSSNDNNNGSIDRVAVIGSGNWGSVIAKIIAQNASTGNIAGRAIDKQVKMWVYEEMIDGKKLTDIINEKKENIKYLPGYQLGNNIIAEPSLINTVKGANLLVFVTPHQFIKSICKQLKESNILLPGTKAISAIKGMEITTHGFELISETINSSLNINCSVIMGANLATGVAAEEFSEATVGYNSKIIGKYWQALFHRNDYFHVATVNDVAGVELCGALKNIVALGSGFCDGLSLGWNTKAAIIRIGLLEMMKLSKRLYPTVLDQTFFESCGIADLITTCSGGRNRKCAESFAKSFPKKSFPEIEKELLNGQKLQGVLTSNEVQIILKSKGWEDDFPLFTTINKISNGLLPPSALTKLQPKNNDN